MCERECVCVRASIQIVSLCTSVRNCLSECVLVCVLAFARVCVCVRV